MNDHNEHLMLLDAAFLRDGVDPETDKINTYDFYVEARAIFRAWKIVYKSPGGKIWVLKNRLGKTGRIDDMAVDISQGPSML